MSGAKNVRLGVNIDHVATLRQARGEEYPRIDRAARIALNSGADQITIHLREDRRHIQDHDVPIVSDVCHELGKPLNLEVGLDEEILKIASLARPDWICLVPEKRQERTTEGGLDLKNDANFARIARACDFLKTKTPKVKISLFVEADTKAFERLPSLDVDAVEIHTGDYASAFNQKANIQSFLDTFNSSKILVESLGLGYHAGHGLSDLSLVPLVNARLFSEYNIGHWIISESVFTGLEATVKCLRRIIDQAQGEA